jgi:thioredoxin-like negative regulator of GroEL
VAQTCQKLDPFNDSIDGLVKQLKSFLPNGAQRAQGLNQLQQMEAMVQTNPGNLDNVLKLAVSYYQMQNTARALELFDLALNNSNISAGDVAQIVQLYSQLNNVPKVEVALHKLVALSPNVPEPRYDLARVEAIQGQTEPALKDLQAALEMSQARLKADPAASNLLAEARKDTILNSLRNQPAFQKLVPPK